MELEKKSQQILEIFNSKDEEIESLKVQLQKSNQALSEVRGERMNEQKTSQDWKDKANLWLSTSSECSSGWKNYNTTWRSLNSKMKQYPYYQQESRNWQTKSIHGRMKKEFILQTKKQLHK